MKFLKWVDASHQICKNYGSAVAAAVVVVDAAVASAGAASHEICKNYGSAVAAAKVSFGRV